LIAWLARELGTESVNTLLQLLRGDGDESNETLEDIKESRNMWVKRANDLEARVRRLEFGREEAPDGN
jgi:hypothetical protein